jgi:hypothetical protein
MSFSDSNYGTCPLSTFYFPKAKKRGLGTGMSARSFHTSTRLEWENILQMCGSRPENLSDQDPILKEQYKILSEIKP